jgi:hypothetical protein
MHRLVLLGLSVILCKPLSNSRRSHTDGRIVGGFVIGWLPKHFCADRAPRKASKSPAKARSGALSKMWRANPLLACGRKCRALRILRQVLALTLAVLRIRSFQYHAELGSGIHADRGS